MDKTITTYPKVGTSVATDWVNRSAVSARGEMVSRRAYTSMVQDALAIPRRNVHERLGHQGAITARISYPNTEYSGQTLRNTYTVPSRTGLSDFWDTRRYGQRS